MTREPQYQPGVDHCERNGFECFGLMSSHVWFEDPRRIVFVLSRYKFAAKMLSGSDLVVEVGCADAFGSRIVAQEVGTLHLTDFDPVFVKGVGRPGCFLHDMVKARLPLTYEGLYAIDVLEHIAVPDECAFVRNIAASLSKRGVCLIGTPSIQSQPYASPGSRAGHVNCKDAKGLKDLMRLFFHNVFIFSMNDEVVHTGFYPMAHYLWALACNKIE